MTEVSHHTVRVNDSVEIDGLGVPDQWMRSRPCHGMCRTRSPAANSRIIFVNARIAAAKWR
jgi:hypothetical protein